MNTSHTPGPWLNGWGKVTDSDGKAICMVIHRKNGDNARLIASAPELLSALELALSWLESAQADQPEDWQDNRLSEAVNSARAIISKAKGLQ